ncbi:MAG: hypothetical protein ACR2G2_05495 [Pseudonocardia sp.]
MGCRLDLVGQWAIFWSRAGQRLNPRTNTTADQLLDRYLEQHQSGKSTDHCTSRLITEAFRVEPDWGMLGWFTMVTGARRGELCASAGGMSTWSARCSHSEARLKPGTQSPRSQVQSVTVFTEFNVTHFRSR